MPKHILICTDLDRTLLPNGRQPESPKARAFFARLVSRPEVTLAYVSGRHRELIEDAIREYGLPLPDWVIGDVGTTIYRVCAGEWLHWHAWEQDIATDWRGLTANNLRPLFTDLPSLRLQEESKQNRYKLSYYLPLQTDIDTLQREMSQRLNAQKVAASLIYSVDEAALTGLLDVLPTVTGGRFLVTVEPGRNDLGGLVQVGGAGHPAILSEDQLLEVGVGHVLDLERAVQDHLGGQREGCVAVG